MRNSLRALGLLPLLAIALYGQHPATPMPVSGVGIDFFSSFDRDIYDLVTSTSPFFTGIALGLLNKIAVALFVVVIGFAGLESATHRHFLNVPYIIKAFYIPYAFAFVVLTYWNTPIPGLGYSFLQLFTESSAQLAAHVDISTLDVLETRFNSIRLGMGPWPNILNGGAFITYLSICAGMAVVKAVIFTITTFGFVAIGVGSCIGPIFVIFYMFPPLRTLWSSWVHFMIKFALYRVIANIVVSIWTLALVNYIDSTLHGAYDLPHFMALSITMLALMLAFVLSIFKVPSLTSDITSGGMNSAHGIGAAVLGFARGMFS